MTTHNMARRVADEVKVRARQIAKGVADTVGEPMDGVALSREEQARMWRYANPKVPPMEHLLALGIPPAQAVSMRFPNRLKLIGQGPPDTLVEKAERFSRLAAEYDMEALSDG